MNEQSNLTHKPLLCCPAMQADVDKLESVFRMIVATYGQAENALSALHPIDGSPIVQLAPGVLASFVDPTKKYAFKGVAACTHCVARAAMLFRDLANTCDDLVKEAEKHGKAV